MFFAPPDVMDLGTEVKKTDVSLSHKNGEWLVYNTAG